MSRMFSVCLRLHPISIWFRSSRFGVHLLCHDVSLHCATDLAYFHTARGFSSPSHSFVPSASECEMDLFYDDGEDLAISPPLFVLHCFHALSRYHCRALHLNFVVSHARCTFGLSQSERVPQTDTLERVVVPPPPFWLPLTTSRMFTVCLRLHPISIWFRSSRFGVHPVCHDVSLHCTTTWAYFHTACGFSFPSHSFVPSASECEMDCFYNERRIRFSLHSLSIGSSLLVYISDWTACTVFLFVSIRFGFGFALAGSEYIRSATT